MTPERITKLAVRSIWPEKSPMPCGIPEFTPQDIALGVAHCNNIGGSILLHKYVFNQVTERQCPAFYREVWGLAINTAIEHEWDDGPKGEMWYRKLAHAALYEILSPSLNCPSCRGAKFIGQRQCTSCRGTGRDQIDSDDRGEALGIGLGQWNNGHNAPVKVKDERTGKVTEEIRFMPPWKARYEVIYRKLNDLEHEAGHQLAALLADEKQD